MALFACSLTLFYLLMICCAMGTALLAKEPDRRKTALKILKILSGYGSKTKDSRSAQKGSL